MLQVSVQADFLLLGFLKTEQNHTRDQIKIASALWEQIRSARIQAFVTPRCFDRVCSALSGHPNAKEVIASIRSVLEVLPHDPIIDEIAAASESPYDYAVEVAYAREYGLDGIIADSRQGFCESDELMVFLPGALLLEVQQFDAFNPTAWKQISDRYREEFLNAANHAEESDQNKLKEVPQNRSDNAGETAYTKGTYQPVYSRDETETTLEEKVLSAAAYTTFRSANSHQAAVRVEVGLANQSLTFEQAFSTNAALVWIRYTSAADKPIHAAQNSESSWLTSLLPFKQDLLDLTEPPLPANARFDRNQLDQGMIVTVLSANAQEFTRQNFFEFSQILVDRSPRPEPTSVEPQPILVPSSELVNSVRAVVQANRAPQSEPLPDSKKPIAEWQIAPVEEPTLHPTHSQNLELSIEYLPLPSAPTIPTSTPTSTLLLTPPPSQVSVTPSTVFGTPMQREGEISVPTPALENAPQGDEKLDASTVQLALKDSETGQEVSLQIEIHLSKDDSASVTVVFQKSEKFGLIGGVSYDDATTEKTASESKPDSRSIKLSLQPNLLNQATLLEVSRQTLSQEFEVRRSQLPQSPDYTQTPNYNSSTAWTVGEAHTSLGEIKLEVTFSRLAGQPLTIHTG
ncbi:hypothetical protein ACKFKF_05945 [Phormidesmis sp. 146-12]